MSTPAAGSHGPPDRERLARVFVRGGLERGDKVLYSSEREDLDELCTRLTDGDETLAAALDTGPLSVRRTADVYTPDGHFDVHGCSTASATSTPRRSPPATAGLA